VIFYRVLWTIKIYRSKIFAIYYILILSFVRIIYINLVSRSTTTIIISYLSKLGSFVIKSIVIHSYSFFSALINYSSLYRVYLASLSR
jgi:hypothetical protein